MIPEDQGTTRRPSDDLAPRASIRAEHRVRFQDYDAIRRPMIDPDARDYVRTTLFIAPFYSLFPGSVGWTNMQLFVPIDDDHTMFHFIQVHHDKPQDEPCDAHGPRATLGPRARRRHRRRLQQGALAR